MATNYGTLLDDEEELISEVSSKQQNGSDSGLVPNYPRYHLSTFKDKGAVLIFLMSFCGFCIFQFLGDEYYSQKSGSKIGPAVILITCMLVYPIFGWLADVHYGRYKVIKWSLRITLIALILFCLAAALSERIPKQISKPLTVILFMLVSLGLGGFQANIVQFGIDQLTDASSTEITSFLRWYIWMWFLSGSVSKLSQSCLCSDYEAVGFLLLPTVVTFAICLEVILNHWLVKEPVSDNPFILIFKVLRYAAKNKYPRLRNAFTYWDDKRYHRIDLAKTKYGGPYTTEQVEDVKTFFRIVSVVVLGTFFTGLYITMFPAYDKIFYHLRDVDYREVCEYSYVHMRNCFQRVAIRYCGGFVIVIGMPLFEFVIRPFFKRYFEMSILKRVMIGIVLFFLSVASCAVIEAVAQHESHSADPHFNVSCPLDQKLKDVEPNNLSIDHRWMILPYLLNDFAQYTFLTSTLEFLCAQSPYSMKGLLFGFTYGSVGLFVFFAHLLMIPVKVIAERKTLSYYGCTFWYLILNLGILIIILMVIFIVIKCYKRRSRNNIE